MKNDGTITLSDETKVKLSFKSLWALILLIVGCTLFLSNTLIQTKQETKELRQEVSKFVDINTQQLLVIRTELDSMHRSMWTVNMQSDFYSEFNLSNSVLTAQEKRDIIRKIKDRY